jgi:hypothetical protein
MILILIVIMQSEVPVIPSIRLQALGTDFTQLIDDPVTDLQIFPARLAELSSPTAYVHPEIPASGMGGTVTLTGGFFLPRTTGLSTGFWHTFSVYDNTSVQVETDTVYSHQDSTLIVYNFGRQQPSLILAFPFLKAGGWTALKFDHRYFYANNDMYECHLFNDTSGIAGDTNIDYSGMDRKLLSDIRSPLWSVTLNQYLPLGEIASLDLAVKYDQSRELTTRADTTIDSGVWASIHHTGTSRYANYMFTDRSSLMDLEEKIMRNTVSLIGTYQRLPSWGMTRISGRFGYGFGQNEDRTTETYHDRSISRYEYSDTDTSYAYADTQLTEDSYSSDVKSDVKQFNGFLGYGMAYYGIDNLAIFAGLKVEYLRRRVSIGEPGFSDQDKYIATVPIGFEWYPVENFCLRYGLRCSYLYSHTDTGIEFHSKGTEQEVYGNGSIGFGLQASDRLRIDFVSKSGMFSIGDDWGLDLQYAF